MNAPNFLFVLCSSSVSICNTSHSKGKTKLLHTHIADRPTHMLCVYNRKKNGFFPFIAVGVIFFFRLYYKSTRIKASLCMGDVSAIVFRMCLGAGFSVTLREINDLY